MLLDFPQVLDMPICECHDKIIDVRNKKDIKYDSYIDTRDDIKTSTKMREPVYIMLVKAQKIFKERYGFNIRLLCGYRNKKTQEIMFQKYWDQNKQEFPGDSDYETYKKVIKLISPLKTWDGKINVPPHSTGGAVDIDLTDEKTDEVVDMGMDVKNCKNVKPTLCWPDCKEISEKAQKNRKIMTDVMEEVGFAPHSREYWHFSYGDRLWAVRRNKKFAIYDSVDIN